MAGFERPGHNPVRHRYTEYADRTSVAEWMVNFKDVFDMKMLYILAHEWLVEEGWAPRLDQDFKEIYYLHREVANFGTENWIRWRLKKTPEGTPEGKDAEGKKIPMFEFEMDVEFHVLGLNKTELVVDGRKVKADKGEVEIRIDAGLVIDRGRFLSGSFITRPFQKMWAKRIITPRWLLLKKELYFQAYRFREALNTYLQIEKILPDVEFSEFWKKRAEL